MEISQFHKTLSIFPFSVMIQWTLIHDKEPYSLKSGEPNDMGRGRMTFQPRTHNYVNLEFLLFFSLLALYTSYILLGVFFWLS